MNIASKQVRVIYPNGDVSPWYQDDYETVTAKPGETLERRDLFVLPRGAGAVVWGHGFALARECPAESLKQAVASQEVLADMLVQLAKLVREFKS